MIGFQTERLGYTSEVPIESLKLPIGR
jgi:hypothetical protein